MGEPHGSAIALAAVMSTFQTSDLNLATMAEESPAMLWRGDAQGKCVYLNGAMREFWGLHPDDCEAFEWSSSLLAEDQQAVFGPFREAMSTAQPFTCEGRYRRADNHIRVLRTRARPYFDREGSFRGMVGVNEDITELRAAEQMLSARNEELDRSLIQLRSLTSRLALAASISGIAMSEHDEQLRYTWAHNVPNALGKTPTDLVGAEVGAPIERLLRRTLDAGEMQSEEISFVLGEQRLWFDIQTAPSTLEDGHPGVVASALDVTARKLNESKLEVLARELGHRVKNVFSVVQAIIRQSARTTPVPDAFIAAVEARLIALSQAQDSLLSMTDDRFDLASMLRRQLSHLDRVDLDGPEVFLPGRLAPYLSLAVHELGTNALKYGSLREAEGRVKLRWNVADEDCLRLSWAEVGGPKICPSVQTSPRQRMGFGSQLLTKVFEAATDGKTALRFDPDGLKWEATIPTKMRLTL